MIAAHATAVKTWGVSCQTSEESVIKKKKQVIQSDIWIHAEDTKAASKQAKQGEKKQIYDREVDVGCSAASEVRRAGARDGGGGVIPACAQARASCSRRSFARAWNAVQGQRALRTSVGTRKFFASSSACTRPLSPSHNARHLAKEYMYIYIY